MKSEAAALGSPSLTVLVVFRDCKATLNLHNERLIWPQLRLAALVPP